MLEKNFSDPCNSADNADGNANGGFCGSAFGAGSGNADCTDRDSHAREPPVQSKRLSMLITS